MTELPQGDPRLLETAQVQELLSATLLARLAYVAADGTPRVVPTWFSWNGREVVMCTYIAGASLGVVHPAYRLADLEQRPVVAISIDQAGSVPAALLLRGRVQIDRLEGLPEEHVEASLRYTGQEATQALVAAGQAPDVRSARIRVRPTWVGLIDFTTRMPSARGGVRSP